jgi:hypothetical protein
MDPAGNAMAVWMESANGRPSIWGRRYDAATDSWGTAVTLESDDSIDMAQPRVAMDGQGNAAALWNDFVLPPAGPQPGTIYAAVFTASAGTWSLPFVVEHSDITCLATSGVSMSAAGQAVAVWSGCDSSVQAASFTGPADVQLIDLGSLAASPACAVGGAPDIAADPGGDAVAVWEASDPFGTRSSLASISEMV